MALAAEMGLHSARARLHHAMDRSFLLVERYDRYLDAIGHLQRLHQEDFCQALGVVPEMKYQNEGGPDLGQCFELIRRVTRPSAPQVLRLLDAVVFNAMVGNHDAHAKNFSLLYLEGKPILAPLYDLISTAVYPNLTPKMAMKIGSRYKFPEIQTRHWYQFAEKSGLSKSLFRGRVLELARVLPEKARGLQSNSGFGFTNSGIVREVVALIEQRCALTINRFSDLHPPS